MRSTLDRYLDDPMAFRKEQLLLDAEGTLLGDVIEPWQEEEVFAPLDEVQRDGRYKFHYLHTRPLRAILDRWMD